MVGDPIPCPLCSAPLELKLGKRGHHLWCSECGMYLVAKKSESRLILLQMAGFK